MGSEPGSERRAPARRGTAVFSRPSRSSALRFMERRRLGEISLPKKSVLLPSLPRRWCDARGFALRDAQRQQSIQFAWWVAESREKVAQRRQRADSRRDLPAANLGVADEIELEKVPQSEVGRRRDPDFGAVGFRR